jgi:aldehyde:ferredoxin oxidoreductase
MRKVNLSKEVQQWGYAGSVLVADLSTEEINVEHYDNEFLRRFVGGASLGIRFLWKYVDPNTEWSDPQNYLFIGTGPLGGTRLGGSGTICVVTKGALTNGVASSQGNGYFGPFLKMAGFDSILIKGVAQEWMYMYIHDGVVEIKTAQHLCNKDTWEADEIIRKELGKGVRDLSTLCIGPAGENLIRFATICVDQGHMAAHNGVGAVMGSKKLKAIVVARGRQPVRVKNKELLSEVAKKIKMRIKADKWMSRTLEEGTVGGVVVGAELGHLPLKNYTTTQHYFSEEKLGTYSTHSIRTNFGAKPNPCWACSAKHCNIMQVKEGKFSGLAFEEPEYEIMAACSAAIGVDDVTETVVLASQIDRLGLDGNETGWVIGWLMECYEKGLLKKDDIDGLEMRWGNGEAVMKMLKKIATREGFGNVLAEGVMRASRQVGGEAPNIGIYTLKGNTPRGHDHRVVAPEWFDTCVSNTGTLETHFQSAPYEDLMLPRNYDIYNPEVLPEVEAKIRGSMLFEDSLVTCRFQTNGLIRFLCEAVNAVTDWDMTFDEAMKIGRRAVNLARSFNLLSGIEARLDGPSPRYGSLIPDGPLAGRNKDLVTNWKQMVRKYYKLMGWDEETSKPLPETLHGLDLHFLVPKLWPEKGEKKEKVKD